MPSTNTLILHGTWIPAARTYPAWFAFWAEAAGGRRRPQAKAAAAGAAVPRHPLAATQRKLADAIAGMCGRSASPLRPAGEVFAWLPSIDGALLPSDTQTADVDRDACQIALAPVRIPVGVLEPVEAAELLLVLAGTPDSSELVIGDDLRYWIVATRFGLELVHRQRFVPTLERSGDQHLARWRPLLTEESDRDRFTTLAGAMPPVCRALAWEDVPHPLAPSPPVGEGEGRPGTSTGGEGDRSTPRHLLYDFLGALVDGLARSTKPVARALQPSGTKARRGAQAETVAESWWGALADSRVVSGSPGALRRFDGELRAWLHGAGGGAADTFRVCFRLEPPPPRLADEREARRPGRPAAAQDKWTMRYLLQATDDPSLLVPATDVWRERGTTARFLNRRLDNPQERLLAGLGRAARLFPPIEQSLRAATPEASTLSTDEAHRFIKDSALVLQSSGFGVLVPGLEAKLRLRVRLGSTAADPARTSGKAAFGWDSLVSFDWQVALGDQVLTREEFQQLARLKEPLVQVRGQWVELDPEQMQQALAFFERGRGSGELSLEEALRLALDPDDQTGLPVDRVETAGWVDDLLSQLRGSERRKRVEEPPGFTGTLRPYQKTGVSWLASLYRYGVGGCLADDMGLGKTIELIALLLHERELAANEAAPPPAPVLLVCPTSVVGNWQREIARFAPDFRVLVHHGAGRTREGFAEAAARHDVVLSTYALLHRDEAELLSVEWGAVALDEAQNIKNASTKAAQVARKLNARWRTALTGTPVENRLSELWSIFQFINPGYLGSAEEFRKRFGNPIERANDTGATQRLKALVSPFILRRVKTDRSIIKDLPEKNEMKVYCPLTREQATLYEAVVRDSLRQIEESEGVQRRGLILATLTKLKQVCNHPALFLHDGSALDGRSGKLARLGEMLEEALSVDDRALVFTQYAEMGKLLRAHLQQQFGQEVLLLHGGTPAPERDRMVARFQREGRSPRLFILSIKAGGTGLNLTAANHVFHFDRWWNPAVENQATDRAFRIGQQRNVQVHKFVCSGTFEETIDQLIERKVALAESIVGTSEAWITEMSNKELRSLFALRREEAVSGGGSEE